MSAEIPLPRFLKPTKTRLLNMHTVSEIFWGKKSAQAGTIHNFLSNTLNFTGMKSKNVMGILFGLTLAVTGCTKDSAQVSAACNDTPPTSQITCQAIFTRWFFNKATNRCTEVTYTGCSPIGFATQQECEACKCE